MTIHKCHKHCWHNHSHTETRSEDFCCHCGKKRLTIFNCIAPGNYLIGIKKKSGVFEKEKAELEKELARKKSLLGVFNKNYINKTLMPEILALQRRLESYV